MRGAGCHDGWPRPPRDHRGPAVPASLARAAALPVGWTLRGGRAPHWSSAAGGAVPRALIGGRARRGGTRGQHGGAGAAERRVRDGQRQETGGGEGGGSGAGRRVGTCPSLPFHSLLPAQVTQILGDSSPYALVAKKIDRKLLAGRGGMRRLVPSRPCAHIAPSVCPQCPSTRGSRTRSRCRSAAKPPDRSFAASPFPAGWVWRDPRQGQ